MATRESDVRLKQIYDSGGRTYSISKLNTINQCQYQAYLNYIEKKQGTNNCWAILGGRIHDCIESCIINGDDESIIMNAIQEELENLEMLGLEFPKDRNGNDSIRNNWITNMTMFAKHFKTPKGTFETEQLALFPLRDGIWMMGYIDAVRHNEDGTVWLIDWKTSSQFTKEHLLEAGRQLIVYKKALELQGLTVKRASWCMLKYCVTYWKLKNGKTKEKISEWRNMISDIKNPIEKALIEAGYGEIDIECFLNEAIENNSFDPLPEEVRNKFGVKIYVRDYEITPELEEECMNYLNKSINLYETLGDEEEWKPCDIEKQSFFCSSLCSFSKHCKHYRDYLDKRDAFQKDDDMDLF